MLTINCDEHPFLKRFHKHVDEKGEPNERRKPVLLREDYDRWLEALVGEAPSFFTTFVSDGLHAHPAPLEPVSKPKNIPEPEQPMLPGI